LILVTHQSPRGRRTAERFVGKSRLKRYIQRSSGASERSRRPCRYHVYGMFLLLNMHQVK
jgi:hypothetical protein